MKKDLAIKALDMAVRLRQPPEGCLFHSDRGSQYCSYDYQKKLHTPDPTPPFMILRNHVAFYASAMDACFVNGERVVAQPGGFYGGWITSAVAGPFKGVPGSRFW